MNAEFYRPTWAEVDLGAIEYNFRQLKQIVGKKTKVLAAVKADAYGHGLYGVSKRLEACKVDYLGVASVDEAIELREKGIRSPVIVLSAILKSEARPMVEYDITATIADISFAKFLNSVSKNAKRPTKVHVKVDTGMGRLGVWHDEADSFVREVAALPHLELEGIYTHFPVAEELDDPFTDEQLALFNLLIERLAKERIRISYRHAANSMALVSRRHSHLNLVRPGLMIYGLHPSPCSVDMVKLKPALSFKTKIVFLKRARAGRSISYGRTHITKRETTIATLAVGYGDGYNRLLSNKASVLIRGVRAPVIGRVCMDQTMVDVGDVKGVAVGDEVVLIGAQGKEKISAEELARLCSTIPYEITCWISRRVPRIYIKAKNFA